MERLPEIVIPHGSHGRILGQGAQLQARRLAAKDQVISALPPVPYSESRQVIRRLRLKDWKRKVAAEKADTLRSRRRFRRATIIKMGEKSNGDAVAVYISEEA